MLQYWLFIPFIIFGGVYCSLSKNNIGAIALQLISARNGTGLRLNFLLFFEIKED